MKKLITLTVLTSLLTLKSFATYLHIDNYLGSQVSISFAGKNYTTVSSGRFTIEKDFNETYKSFCTDPYVRSYSGEYKSFTDLDLAKNIHNSVPALIDWNGQLVNAFKLYKTYNNQVDDKKEYSALQLAIWEVLYDTDFNLSTGNFRAKDYLVNGISNLAQDYLNGPLTDLTINDRVEWWQPLTSDGNYRLAQGLITIKSVPENGNLLGIAGLTIIGLFYARRKTEISK